MAKREYGRLAWEDRFNEPSAAALRAGLHGQPRRLFDAFRKYMLQIEGVQETFAWYGESWRWSIEYRVGPVLTNGAASKRRARVNTDEDELLAVLIPSPEDLQLAMRVDPELAETLPMRGLKRAVRDGLDLAAEPFDTRWGLWSLQHPNLSDDLKQLVMRKLSHMKRSTV